MNPKLAGCTVAELIDELIARRVYRPDQSGESLSLFEGPLLVQRAPAEEPGPPAVAPIPREPIEAPLAPPGEKTTRDWVLEALADLAAPSPPEAIVDWMAEHGWQTEAKSKPYIIVYNTLSKLYRLSEIAKVGARWCLWGDEEKEPAVPDDIDAPDVLLAALDSAPRD